MLAQFAHQLQGRPDLKSIFYTGQMFIVVAIAAAVWFLRPKDKESNFQSRESDLKQPKSNRSSGPDLLAEARIQKQETLRLTGIRIDGAPHEILGIPQNSNPNQIQQAYRDLMKRYHPDRVGQPGSREWKDAQKIAEAINRAKDEMLKRK